MGDILDPLSSEAGAATWHIPGDPDYIRAWAVPRECTGELWTCDIGIFAWADEAAYRLAAAAEDEDDGQEGPWHRLQPRASGSLLVPASHGDSPSSCSLVHPAAVGKPAARQPRMPADMTRTLV